MKLSFYEDSNISQTKSVFLAGPTLRNDFFKNSWRSEAAEIFKEKGFDGTLYIPESETGDYEAIGLDDKGFPEWEWERLEECNIIMFWIPRDLETLPGFTTNVEFGRYITLCPENVVLGFPKEAPKNSYLKLLYERYNDDGVSYTLEETIEKVLKRMKGNAL